METELRNETGTLEKRFEAEPWRFDFWQSVKMLQGKPFRFSSHVSQEFPASEVQSITDGAEPSLGVNFLGLAGAHGPLPPPITELILERNRIGDTAIGDFLDLFNHRLVSLFYQAMEPMRPGVGTQTDPAETELAEYLYAIAGLLTPGLRTTENIRYLPHAVLYANIRKTASGLEKIVSQAFGVQATVKEFQGRWLVIDERDRTLLGKQNHKLGEAMLGGRFWDQAAGFVLRLSELSKEMYEKFLPNGKHREELFQLVKFYLGDDLHCDLRLHLKDGERYEKRLNATQLGWT